MLCEAKTLPLSLTHSFYAAVDALAREKKKNQFAGKLTLNFIRSTPKAPKIGENKIYFFTRSTLCRNQNFLNIN
jgi:hypothetical protein